jgi:hypothetical protein
LVIIKNAFRCKTVQSVFLTKKKIVKRKYPFFIFKKVIFFLDFY